MRWPAILFLFIPGSIFPLSLLVHGLMLARGRVVPTWVGLMLALGAAGFPISRFPRIELLAHAADLLLLIPLVWIGLRLLLQDQQDEEADDADVAPRLA